MQSLIVTWLALWIWHAKNTFSYSTHGPIYFKLAVQDGKENWLFIASLLLRWFWLLLKLCQNVGGRECLSLSLSLFFTFPRSIAKERCFGEITSPPSLLLSLLMPEPSSIQTLHITEWKIHRGKKRQHSCRIFGGGKMLCPALVGKRL